MREHLFRAQRVDIEVIGTIFDEEEQSNDQQRRDQNI